ncbi:hypothetical protein UFOVP558_47 [uncultured Caudovirales phage]|uniref:Uncharacterized protein n=1 Tax=uncultured Caudovirales phage TaxID=2100421 RepID=A0A6J5MXV9_9CAUD|nr:hypothetical protein UFOVP558_47 [uncultured Caudovirales phage]
MSELGETFAAWREHKKEKKKSNLHKSLFILDQAGIPYRMLSDTHYRVGEWDFWPSTGLFINTRTKKRARGVFNLIKKFNNKGAINGPVTE